MKVKRYIGNQRENKLRWKRMLIRRKNKENNENKNWDDWDCNIWIGLGMRSLESFEVLNLRVFIILFGEYWEWNIWWELE